VSNEIRMYQSDNGLRLQTDCCYKNLLELWLLPYTDFTRIWKVAEQILAIMATSTPSECVLVVLQR